MKIVFLLPQGTVEWEVPEDQRDSFSFPHFVNSVRGAGFFLAPGIYLRHDAMIGIVDTPGAVQPIFPQTVGSA